MPAWFERLVQDVRHALRVFAKNPGFTAICILSIACGTGANVAMFSVADALLLRPLPVPRPDELLLVGSPTEREIMTVTGMSHPDYVDVAAQSRSFDGLMAHMLRRAAIVTQPGAVPQVRVINLVSGNFLDVLGIQPVVGRTFSSGEDRVAGRDAVAVLSYGLWQQRYAGDRNVAGRTLRISGVDFTIVGVTPQEFSGLENVAFPESVYIPLAMAPALGDEGIAHVLSARDLRVLSVRGRLRPGVDVADARAEMAAIGANLARAYPDTNRAHAAMTVRTEIEERFASNYLDAGLVLLLAILSTAVLAVACANVAGLLASRAPLRAREMALRLAVGAGRARLVRQLLTESLALSLFGGIAGVGVGYAGIVLLRQMQLPTDMVQVPQMQIDQRALVFTLIVALASAFLFGLAPAFQTTRIDLMGAMKNVVAAPGRRWWRGGRNGLVALQVALSLVLVSIAGYALQVFHRVATTGPGFRTSQLAKVSVDTANRHYTDAQASVFAARAADAARRLPQVKAATVSSAMPFWMVDVGVVAPEPMDPADDAAPRVLMSSVDEGYFATMDIPLLGGRPFRATDTADSPPVAIVNRSFAEKHWPNGDPVGKRIRQRGSDRAVEIVGVAQTSKYTYIVEPRQDMVYFPFRQQPRRSLVLLARTAGESRSALDPLRDVVRDLDPGMPTYDVQTMEAFYAARGTGLVGVAAEMIAGLGAMGVMLTMVGLYGLVSYSVSRRTREIGIRMAIGATSTHVLRMILEQGMRPAWLGLPVGVVLSAVVVRMLPTLFPTDGRANPWLIALFGLFLLAVTLASAFVPARRAARVNPMVALRYE